MRTFLALFLLSLAPAVPAIAQGSGSNGPAKVVERSEVALAATVVPDRLEQELLSFPGGCHSPRFRIGPEGRTYGQTAVRRLQRAWRDGKVPKPDPKMPQNSAQEARPGKRR